ncbi:hypothetical protein [Streptomyces sp. NBC_00986]|uniref:hypothetical protein n=1 Tax=Streptomyces sp. NBC_00986 TaxID=2903702 RepID=UPI0038672FC4|nr:hypothetical protein OG504_50340 [Streptomyces sp. NBC_00986]
MLNASWWRARLGGSERPADEDELIGDRVAWSEREYARTSAQRPAFESALRVASPAHRENPDSATAPEL